MTRKTLAGGLLLSLLAVTAALTMRHSPATDAARAGTAVDASNFVNHITNPWLPYRPGSRWVYRGIKDGQDQIDVVKATHRTKLIEGVTCTAVSDIATHNGTVLERTTGEIVGSSRFCDYSAAMSSVEIGSAERDWTS